MFKRKVNSSYDQGAQETRNFDNGHPSNYHSQDPNAAYGDGPPATSLNPDGYPPPPIPDTTTIGQNFNLEGDNIVIRSKGALAINGTVSAEIHCEHLTIGSTAQITGAIAADEINIHGQVKGIINGAQVTLHETAHVDADINSQYLSIQRGAQFDGRSRRVEDLSEIAPKLVSSASDTNQPLGLPASQQSDSVTQLSSPPSSIEPPPQMPTTLEPSSS